MYVVIGFFKLSWIICGKFMLDVKVVFYITFCNLSSYVKF